MKTKIYRQYRQCRCQDRVTAEENRLYFEEDYSSIHPIFWKLSIRWEDLKGYLLIGYTDFKPIKLQVSILINPIGANLVRCFLSSLSHLKSSTFILYKADREIHYTASHRCRLENNIHNRGHYLPPLPKADS